MKRIEFPPEEAVALRQRLRTEMFAANAVAFQLSEPSWQGAFIDFPLEVALSYTWTGFWRFRETGSDVPPVLSIGTSPVKDVDILRERMRVDYPTLEHAVDHVVRFETRNRAEQATFRQIRANAAVAEFVDNQTAVVVVTRDLAGMPPRITVSEVLDRLPLIDGWENL